MALNELLVVHRPYGDALIRTQKGFSISSVVCTFPSVLRGWVSQGTHRIQLALQLADTLQLTDTLKFADKVFFPNSNNPLLDTL